MQFNNANFVCLHRAVQFCIDCVAYKVNYNKISSIGVLINVGYLFARVKHNSAYAYIGLSTGGGD